MQQILEEQEATGDERQSRRTRGILIGVLILLLLLLCGVGAFLYRLISPSGTGDKAELKGITWIRSIYAYGPSAAEHFLNPTDAAIGADGLIWVTDAGRGRIVGFRGDGSYARQVAGSLVTGQPFRIPSRVAIDPDGIFYVIDRAAQKMMIMDGQQVLATASIPGIQSVDANDDMVVVGSESGFAILDKDGNVQKLIGTKGPGEDQFDTVQGVAIDSANRVIYLIDTYNNRLSAWDYAGKRQWMVSMGNPANDVQLEGGASLDTSIAAPAKLQLPTDITVDGAGRPIVLDAFDFSISAFDPENGKFIGKYGTYGDKDGQFMYPTGLTYDTSKDWFVVADTQNLRAQIIRIPDSSAGGASGILSGLSRLMAGPLRALWPCLILLPLLLIGALIARRIRRRNAEEGLSSAEEYEPPPQLSPRAPSCGDLAQISLVNLRDFHSQTHRTLVAYRVGKQGCLGQQANYSR